MKKWLMTGVALSSLVANRVYADEPATDIADIQKEIGELKLLIEELNLRLSAIEERVAAFEVDEQDLYPWQREQPFFWDSRMPVNTERWLRERRRQRLRNPTTLPRGRSSR